MHPDFESLVRLSCFAGVLFGMLVWEMLAPRRRPLLAKSQRWLGNLGLVALNTIAVRLLLPLSGVALALMAEERGWGLFNNVNVPLWGAVVLSIVALDLVIYLQHVLFHAVPALWRLHMVHHADLDFDASTGARFHTIEIILSMGIKAAAIVVLGTPALAFVIFEVALNAASIFNHGNVQMPAWLDRMLRLVLVTPDMHRVHHSVLVQETNSNFGFNLSWWDFLFGTYRAQPSLGHERMTIGLKQFRDERVEQLPWMLVLPFTAETGSYPITADRRGVVAGSVHHQS